jgi:protein-S-isoprenylcysteine O-methyltransferase Ste14
LLFSIIEMVALSVGLVVGGLLVAIGATICVYWYIYWERNFKNELLTKGPYRIVRHPFYSGFIIFTLGLTITCPVYETRLLVVFTLAVMVVFIPKEEEQLLKEYQQAYRSYREKVKWKLIPYLY